MNYRTNHNTGSTITDHRSLATDTPAPRVEPQLELAFAAEGPSRRANPGQPRLSRAGWWFQWMRQIVDRARDWQPALAARPEQIWLPDVRREISGAPRLIPEQHQICE